MRGTSTYVTEDDSGRMISCHNLSNLLARATANAEVLTKMIAAFICDAPPADSLKLSCSHVGGGVVPSL